MDFNFLRNWFGPTSASPDNASSELDSVEQLTSTSLDSFDVTSDLKVLKEEENNSEITKADNGLKVEEKGNDYKIEEEVDDFELVSLPESPQVDESDPEIAGFNREKLLEMCTFSQMVYYSNDTELSQTGCKTKAELFNEGYSIIPFCYSNGIQAGFIFTKGGEVTIAYRGTKDSADIMRDANGIFSLAAISPEGQRTYNGRMHSGFHYGFQDSLPSLYTILGTHANEQKVKIKDLKFNFTGHSMGGALGKIAALYFNKKEGAEDIHVATFGDPSAFDRTASEVYHEALPGKTLTVAQAEDPIPKLTPDSFGYKNVGELLITQLLPGCGVHRIKSYYKAIREMKKEDFKPNNDVSFLHCLSEVSGRISCALGDAQYYANKLIVRAFGESQDIYDKIKEDCEIKSWFSKVKTEKVRIEGGLESLVHVMPS